MKHAFTAPRAGHLWGWCLCILAISASPQIQAEPPANSDLIQEMSQAIRTLNYRGVMVYARNGEMRGLRIVHRYEEGREQERIQSLGAEPREVIRDEDVVTCILPKDRQVMLDRRDFRGVMAGVRQLSLQELSPHYQVEQEQDSRLINRQCRVYRFQPQDQYRYGFRVWVDDVTSLPLRMDLIGEKGQVLEQTMFTQLDFPASISDEELQPQLDPMTYQWIRQDETDSMPVEGESHWQLNDLPPGFRLVERGMRMPAEGDIPIEHLLFTDGLATVSVMLRPQGDKRLRFQGYSRMGAVHVYSSQINGQHVTVMGEVPRATVEYFGQHLQAVNTQSPTMKTGAKLEAAADSGR